jgi:hypothetical protein
MNRQMREELRVLERHAVAEDPALDRTLRGGMPSSSRRRRGRWCVALGAAMFLTSLLAAFPFGALAGLTIAAASAYFSTHTDGQRVDLTSIFQQHQTGSRSGRRPR